MSFVIGREKEDDIQDRPTGNLGRYRAHDGSAGASLYLDLDRPHAILVVGKRGYGKSYTLGVVAEELARARGVAPTVLDPMGVFTTLAEESDGAHVPGTVLDSPAIAPTALDPKSWCSLLSLSPESAAGSLVWQAAQDASTIDSMRRAVRETAASQQDKRAALNHLTLAESWDVFDENGIDAHSLAGGEITVVDLSGLDTAPMNAVCRGVAETLYRARIDTEISRLPWLLVDECHTFFRGVADDAIQRILTRGRTPGVSLVSATQRPSAIPETGISQSDILISHRLTSLDDIEALRKAQPTYLDASLTERMPTEPGEVVIVDDSTETVHTGQIRRRETPHGGDSPAASDVSESRLEQS